MSNLARNLSGDLGCTHISDHTQRIAVVIQVHHFTVYYSTSYCTVGTPTQVPLSERYKREAFIPKLPEGKPKRRKPALPSTKDAVLESTNSEDSDILGLASLFGD